MKNVSEVYELRLLKQGISFYSSELEGEILEQISSRTGVSKKEVLLPRRKCGPHCVPGEGATCPPQAEHQSPDRKGVAGLR